MLKLGRALRSVHKPNYYTIIRLNSSLNDAPVLTSTYDENSQTYKENYAQMKTLVDQLNTTTKSVLSGGNNKNAQKVRERHTGKGKLLARDRIKYLLDPK